MLFDNISHTVWWRALRKGCFNANSTCPLKDVAASWDCGISNNTLSCDPSGSVTQLYVSGLA